MPLVSQQLKVQNIRVAYVTENEELLNTLYAIFSFKINCLANFNNSKFHSINTIIASGNILVIKEAIIS